MTALLLFAFSASASPAVGAVMEPDDVVEQYRLHANSKGKQGPDAELLCKTAVEGLQVCASVLDGKTWRYATHADAEVTSPTEALKGPRLGFVRKSVDGIGGYWVRSENDGREGLIFVRPEALKMLTPAELVVAWPQPGVVIAWVPGNPSLDQVLSVGVAKMVEATNHPISQKLYRHDGEEWLVWGEAKAPQAP